MYTTDMWAYETAAEVEELESWMDEDLEEIRDDENWLDQYVDLLDEEDYDYDYEYDEDWKEMKKIWNQEARLLYRASSSFIYIFNIFYKF